MVTVNKKTITSPSTSLSEGEGAVLQIFSQLFVLPHQLRIFILHISITSILLDTLNKMVLCVGGLLLWRRSGWGQRIPNKNRLLFV